MPWWWLNSILPHLMSNSLTTFVLWRLITDNVLIAFESFTYIRHKQCGRKWVISLKLDMSKSYDWVEWSFLELIMLKLGFGQRWMTLVLSCINSVSYKILVNGVPFTSFGASRGLRQGDSLSLYFFILCARILLSSSICRA